MKALWKASLLASVAFGVMATSAVAQDESAPAAEDVSEVEGLVVTARRTEESLQRVPGSVSAFSGAALEQQGVDDVTDLQGQVPNLNIAQGRGSSDATNIFIRGIGQPDALQTFDPAVGVYVDDVYYSRIRGTQFELFDLERVEVLRGPQGTLYGKNTIGGALKLISRKPDEEFRAMGSVTVGSYSQIEGRAAVSGPVAEGLYLGAAIMHAQRDGFVEDPVSSAEYNDRNVTAGRLQLAWEPSDNFRLDLSADITSQDTAMTVGRAEAPLVRTNIFPIFLPPATVLQGAPAPGSEFNFRTRTTPGLPNSSELQHWGLSAVATFEVSDTLTIKSITAYRELDYDDFIDIDATQFELGDVFVGVDQSQQSQEFQVNWTPGDWTVVSGVYFLREEIRSHQEAYADDLFTILDTPVGFTRFIDDDLRLDSLAAYVNGTYQWTDQLRLTVGARITHEEKEYFRTTTVDWAGVPAPVAIFFPDSTFAFTTSESWQDFSPMASLDYQVTDDLMVYGRVAKGFKSGGFNGRANNPGEETPYDPETVVSYELGLKSQWFDNRLRANLAVFHNDYTDFQARISQCVVQPGFPVCQIELTVLNAGELNLSGAELELYARPIDGLTLDAQIGYLDAEYGEFVDLRFPGADRSFQTPAFAPEWTLRFGGAYEIDLGDLGGVTIGAQARYKSEHALAVDNTTTLGAEYPGMWQDDFWIWDARAVWESADGRFTAGLYGRNLGDEVYKTDAQEFSSVGGIQTAYYGAPRTVSFTVTARY